MRNHIPTGKMADGASDTSIWNGSRRTIHNTTEPANTSALEVRVSRKLLLKSERSDEVVVKFIDYPILRYNFTTSELNRKIGNKDF